VLVDLPGHGRHAGEADAASFALGSTLERIAASGAWPADLVGYSMGARIALHFAATHPDRVRKLVMESGSPGLEAEAERAERRRSDAALAARLRRDGVEAFVEFWDAQPLFATRRALGHEVLRAQRALRLRNDPESLATSLEHHGTGALPDLWDELPRLGMPVLLVVGELDPKFVGIAERMAARLPDARIRVVEGAGHTVHLERPEAWLEAVVAFLD
jgi:2-succinyl-6-hydroxy-2,4-cyclohexadiene-1-carboxylate synthase